MDQLLSLANKWGLRIFLYVALFLGCVGLASLAWISGYVYWIPRQITHHRPLFFHYAPPPSEAMALADLSGSGTFTQVLRNGQPYQVTVELLIPASAHNLDLGTFMLTTTLLNLPSPSLAALNVKDEAAFLDYAQSNGTIMYRALKPYTLPYFSPSTRLIRYLFTLPLSLLFNVNREDELVRVLAFDGVFDDYKKPITHALISLSPSVNNPAHVLNVYYAAIRLDARFDGVSYLLYSYWSYPLAFITILSIALFLFATVVLTAWLVKVDAVPEVIAADVAITADASIGKRKLISEYTSADFMPTPPPELLSDINDGLEAGDVVATDEEEVEQELESDVDDPSRLSKAKVELPRVAPTKLEQPISEISEPDALIETAESKSTSATSTAVDLNEVELLNQVRQRLMQQSTSHLQSVEEHEPEQDIQ